MTRSNKSPRKQATSMSAHTPRSAEYRMEAYDPNRSGFAGPQTKLEGLLGNTQREFRPQSKKNSAPEPSGNAMPGQVLSEGSRQEYTPEQIEKIRQSVHKIQDSMESLNESQRQRVITHALREN